MLLDFCYIQKELGKTRMIEFDFVTIANSYLKKVSFLTALPIYLDFCQSEKNCNSIKYFVGGTFKQF